jgi:hypothetical protein
MKPLILTGEPIHKFEDENLGDLQAVFVFHFAGGKLPSPAKLAAHLDRLWRWDVEKQVLVDT